MTSKRRAPSGLGVGVLLLSLLVLTLSCGDGPTGGGNSPAEIQIVSGSGQEAQVGKELPSLLSVRVVNGDGGGVNDVVVTWSVASGGGTITAVSGQTDGSGTASARWILGQAAGTHSVTATAAGLATVTFTANALPGPATTIVPVDGQLQSASAGTRLAKPLVVEARDAFGNPVPDVAVAWSVVAGDGSVSPASSVTGPDGRAAAEWTLGPIPGDDHNARAALPGGQATVFYATALAGAPAAIVVDGGQDQIGETGEELPQPLRVRVTDERGNPVPGVTVMWTTQPGGGFRAASSKTDATGYATAFWRLGDSPTVHSATAEVDGLDPVTFTAHAFADLPVNVPLSGLSAGRGTRSYFRVALASASSQLTISAPGAGGQVGVYARRGALPTPDDHDCALAPPGGDPTCVVPNAQPGDYFVLVDALADFAGLDLRASIPLNISIENAFITQAAQSWAGDVPLVAGRPGMLRVFASSSTPGLSAPPVRVTFYHGAAEVGAYTIPKAGTIPTGVSLNAQAKLADSWNLIVPADLIQPGLAFRVELAPDGEIVDDNADDDVFPRGGGVRVADVVEVPLFRITFVPVFSSVTGLQGRIDAQNVEGFLSVAKKVLPLGEIDWEIAEPISIDRPMTNSSDWTPLIDALKILRKEDRHYYGVVQFPPVQGEFTLGVGQIGRGIAAGIDQPANDLRAWVAAHEWGHNFGRLHAPCGLPASEPFPDRGYPYADGSIGIYGVEVGESVEASATYHPESYADVMSYCRPSWISDYNFRHVLAFRAQAAGAGLLAGVSGEEGAAPTEPVLHVSGGVRDGVYELDPAIRADGRPSLPTASGEYALDGFDQDGNRLFTLSFETTPLLDAGADIRRFGFAIPAWLAPPDRLHELRFSGPDGQVSRVAAGPATAGPPVLPPAATRPAAGADGEVRWDAAAYPKVIVRDAGSGRVIGIGHSGTLVLPDAPAELEITFSDGIRSWTRRQSLPR